MGGGGLPKRPDPKRRPRLGSEDGPIVVTVPKEGVPEDAEDAHCKADILALYTAMLGDDQLDRKPKTLKICTIYVPWKLDEDEPEERPPAQPPRPLEDPRLDDEARISALEARLDR